MNRCSLISYWDRGTTNSGRREGEREREGSYGGRSSQARDALLPAEIPHSLGPHSIVHESPVSSADIAKDLATILSPRVDL